MIWPADDQHAREHIEGGVPLLLQAVGLCAQHRRAIQAGGCVGLYPLLLAEHFARVHTWEPSPDNAELLCRNLAGIGNVYLHADALSDGNGIYRLRHTPGNCGGTHLEPSAAGEVASARLDDYAMDDVDLIQLDVEGMEAAVLRGAEATIERCRPVVMVEVYAPYSVRAGWQDPVTWLEARGYREIARNDSDRVLVHG
jgi:FkbM family methyltransferase